MLSHHKKQKGANNEDPFLMRKLRAAIAYANNTCLFAGNKIEDMERTSGWSLKYSHFFANSCYEKNHSTKTWHAKTDSNSDNKSLYTNIYIRKLSDKLPLNETLFKRKPALFDLVIQSLVSIKIRSGECSERSRLAAKYLWENSEGITSIEAISMQTFNHGFLIVNRSGDITNPDTWGDAWIVDPWTKDGLIYHAREFHEKIKETRVYIKYQFDEFAKIGIRCSPLVDCNQEQWICRWVLIPEIDNYPSYLSHMKIEDYYEFDDRRFTNSRYTEQQARDEHKKLFQDCLAEIKSLGLKWR